MEKVAILISIYAALLSTFLAIREVIKERRRLKVILEYVEFFEVAQIKIVNVGVRPITVTDIAISVVSMQGENKCWEGVPFDGKYRTGEDYNKLPHTLDEGEQVTLQLSDVVSQMLVESRFAAKIFVYDAAGNTYTKFDTRSHNPKSGEYTKIGK